MFECLSSAVKLFASRKSVGEILFYGFIIRVIALLYGVLHDSYVDHIKYTDIDYHVFNNGSQSLVNGQSPYINKEYRYTPLVAVIFLPNILINKNLGKFLLILADIYGGHIQYRLNIHQGTQRLNSKLFLILWLLNPLTIAISTRGSFEPIITLLVLATVYFLISTNHLLAGLIYGLAIHVKLYPIIYTLTFYIYMIQRKPHIITQTRLSYWIRTISPTANHLRFFSATGFALASSTFICYKCYGHEYLEQSFFYHLKRKDLQHNFSIYFYLFNLLPQYQEILSTIAFAVQFIGVLIVSILFLSLDTNRRTKLRKLTFSLFCTTFLFVSLNKVCTSQYFNWYLIFLPLIIDSIKLGNRHIIILAVVWILTQANWLLFAYLYEYQNFQVLDFVGFSSILFFISNLHIIGILCFNFDATTRLQLRDETKDL